MIRNHRRVSANQISKLFFAIGTFINYTGGLIGNYMYHIIRLHFFVECVHIFIFIDFAVVPE